MSMNRVPVNTRAGYILYKSSKIILQITCICLGTGTVIHKVKLTILNVRTCLLIFLSLPVSVLYWNLFWKPQIVTVSKFLQFYLKMCNLMGRKRGEPLCLYVFNNCEVRWQVIFMLLFFPNKKYLWHINKIIITVQAFEWS